MPNPLKATRLVDKAGKKAYFILAHAKIRVFMEELMNEKNKGSSDAAYLPVNVLDNEAYVKLEEPTVEGFGNTGKDINGVNVIGTHSVVDYYKREA